MIGVAFLSLVHDYPYRLHRARIEGSASGIEPILPPIQRMDRPLNFSPQLIQRINELFGRFISVRRGQTFLLQGRGME